MIFEVTPLINLLISKQLCVTFELANIVFEITFIVLFNVIVSLFWNPTNDEHVVSKVKGIFLQPEDIVNTDCRWVGGCLGKWRFHDLNC